MADEFRVSYSTPPVYAPFKTVSVTPYFEIKSFKSYERLDSDTEGLHIADDDVDDGGGYGNE